MSMFVINSPPKSELELTFQQSSETVMTMQTSLSGEFQRTFTEVLDPRLVSILQEQLQPTNTTSQLQHETMLSKFWDQELSQAAAVETINTASQRQNEIMLSRFQDLELSQAAAVDNIKCRITNAIKDSQKEPSKRLIQNYPSRWQRPRRQQTVGLEQSLETLCTASDNELIDSGSLEDL